MNISNLRMNYLCKVCAEPAAGFHFGAFTCEGCKSFFGRTYNNLSQIHECKNGGQCVINKQNRTSCKACRLRKCLMVGMSKSGSRYGRRSNWFRIHYALQEQAASMNRNLEGHANINLQLNGTQANIPRLSPGTYNEEEGTMSSPALSSPDSNTSDTSLDVEPMRIASYAAMQSSQAHQLPNPNQESQAVQELNRRTRDALVTVGGRGIGPPVSGADFIAGLSFFGIHSGLSLLETSQLYQRLYPSMMSSSQGSAPAQEQVPHDYEPPSPANSPNHARTTSVNPPSPSQSLPPPNTERDQFSNPPSPQSLPAQPFPDRSLHSPSSCSSSPSLVPPRKRTAECHPEQDAPIDLSVKRPKLGGPNPPVSLPDLTPIAMPFNFLHLPALAVPAVPLDLTSNA